MPNGLLSTGMTPATDANGKPLTLEAQQARDPRVATLVAAGAGLDARGAVTSAQIETENNSLHDPVTRQQLTATPQPATALRPGETTFGRNLAYVQGLKTADAPRADRGFTFGDSASGFG